MSKNILSSSVEELVNGTVEVKKGKPGRKPRHIDFPSRGEFTVQEIRQRLLDADSPMTTAAISVRLKKLVEQKKYKITGRRVQGRGQPAIVYRAVKES